MGGKWNCLGSTVRRASRAVEPVFNGLSAERNGRRTLAADTVAFELCGVLCDDTAWRRWLLQLVSRMGLHTHYAAFYRVWDREFQTDVWRGDREFWPALKDFLRSAGLSRGQVDEIEAASSAKFRSFEDDIRPFPGVAHTLRRLSSGSIRLAVTCKRPIRRIEVARLMTQLGISNAIHADFDDDSAQWHECGHRLKQVSERVGRPADRVAYVGRDTLELEIASSLGFPTAAYNHDADATADVYLDQLDQLVDVVTAKSMLAAG